MIRGMDNKALVPPGLSYLADNIKSKGNILGASKKDGAAWAKGLGLPKEKETIFFAGCGYQFDSKLESMMGLIRKMDKSAIGAERAMGLASLQKKMGLDGMFMKMVGGSGKEDGQPLIDAVKVLQKLGLTFGYLAEDEPCCGGILHYMGEKTTFGSYSKEVYAKLKSKGVKQIISIVPSCTYTLKKLMSDAVNGSDIEVKHFSQIVADNLNSLTLRFPKQVKITYHDPCQLARYMGIIDEPRKILKAVAGLNWSRPNGLKENGLLAAVVGVGLRLFSRR